MDFLSHICFGLTIIVYYVLGNSNERSISEEWLIFVFEEWLIFVDFRFGMPYNGEKSL